MPSIPLKPISNKYKDSERRNKMTDKEIDRHYYQVKGANQAPSFTVTRPPASLYKPKKGQR